MDEARSRTEWDHTSQLICTLANIHRDAKKTPRPFKPQQFNPWYANRGERVRSVSDLADDMMRLAKSSVPVNRRGGR